MTDIAVVGAGIGGCMAALTAAREDPSASIRVLAPGPDRYEREPGTIDVLGYMPGDDELLSHPLLKIRDLPDEHPYSKIGQVTVAESLDRFDDLFGGEKSLPYHDGGTVRNGLVPTPNGDVRPVSRYPASFGAGLVTDDRPMRIVGFERVTHVNATFVGNRLDEAVPYDVESTTVEFPMAVSEYPPIEAMARALEDNEPSEDGTPMREALADSVRPHLDVEPRVGFPAVLGLEGSEEVRTELENLLAADVFELPLGEPSVPGTRLRRRLFSLLEDEGVTVEKGETVEEFESDDGTIRKLHVEKGSPIEADTYVLATGGPATGGIESDRDGPVEPIFDCPVPHPKDRTEWSVEEPLGDHQFARFGVDITEELRPCRHDGEPVYENLRAVGDVIGGWDFTAEHSRSGVAVASGYEAGRLAADDVS